ncbi:MBL fold metallo-hydrolase [Verrucomicrobia bacterium]|nr:MBL fold metallo-hydrolase [Verrucomicrobiota bacterium]
MTKINEQNTTSRRKFLKVAGVAGAATMVATGLQSNSQAAQHGDDPIAITEPKPGPYLYKHKSDFSVITVGTGCPEPVIGRSGPCAMVQYKGNYFLVDVGAGTTKRLCEMGISPGAIKNVLFTHHHADHNEGYTKWLINSWMVGRTSLDLVGPPTTKAFHELLVTFYAKDLKYRATLQGLPLEAMYNAKIQEFEGANTFNIDGVKISTAELTHTMYNLGYRFEVDGKVIVVSGDTSFDEDLITLAKDADVLIMDSGMVPNTAMIGASMPMAEDAAKKSGPPPAPPKNTDKTSVRPHPGPGEVAKMAMGANVKKLVLTHFPPFMIDEAKTIQEIKDAGFKGEVIIGEDLMEITA